ncbi:MAG: hypothetical protein IT381_18430 [Deltaproteobacteria bacterium]|nr:hypothetical protein [Deltaproteobacteria bacterium]
MNQRTKPSKTAASKPSSPFVRKGRKIFVVSNWERRHREKMALRALTKSELEIYDTIVTTAEEEALAWIAK